MAPKTTLWPLDPHTLGKHRVLRHYLNAWLPIMAFQFDEIAFIDGFAGPGEYSGGEDGSPIIAIKAILEHHKRESFRGKIGLRFVEKDPERSAHLETRLEAFREAVAPYTFTVEVINGPFDEVVGWHAAGMSELGEQMIPVFVMVDPFGVSDTPMAAIAAILEHPQSEVYVSVMWNYIDWLHTTKEYPPHLDELFGSPDWRAPMQHPDWRERKRGLFALYKNQLRTCVPGTGIQVTHFELYEGNKLVYAIFHATKSLTGCNRMKQAIWKVAADGVAFRPGSEEALGLFENDTSLLQAQLRSQFGDGEWREMAELEAWIKSDATIFHESHLRKGLAALEAANSLEHRPAPGKKRHGKSYPKDCEIRIPA
jgi:three-Cys-motif partner protein